MENEYKNKDQLINELSQKSAELKKSEHQCERKVNKLLLSENKSKVLIEMYRADDKRVMESGKTEEIDEKYIQDGQEVIIHIVKTPVKDNSSDIGIRGIFWDITEHRRAQEALNESEEKFHSFIEQSGDGIVLTDEQGIIIEWNWGEEQITGLKRDEAVGRYIWDVQFQIAPEVKRTPENYNRLKANTLELIKTGQSPWLNQLWENDIKRHDGTQRSVQVLIFLIKTKKGFKAGCISRDITERKRIEESLREAETKYHTIIENIVEGVYQTTLDGRFVTINSALAHIFGYESPEEFLSKITNARQLYVEPYRRDELVRRVQEYGVVTGFEAQLRHKEGNIIWISLNIRTIYDASGRVTALAGTLLDITESKQIKEKLRKSHEKLELRVQERTRELVKANKALLAEITERKRVEEELRKERDFSSSLVQASPTFVVAIDASGRTLMMNKAMLNALGYTIDEVTGLDYISNFVPGSDRDKLTGIFEKLITSIESTINENRVLAKDGRELLIEWHGRPVFRANGDFDYIFGVGIDITERKKAEETLQQSEEKYRMLIDNIQDGVFIIQDEKIQFANEAFARVCGYTVQEAIGKDFRDLVAPEDMEIVTNRYYQRHAGKNIPREYELHMLHRDGRTRILVNINVGLIIFRGRTASMGTAKDITEKKRLESQLLRAQRMESIGTLASGIAHDINNVLTPIMLSQELLQEKHTDKESRILLKVIERSTQRGASLMKQVQSFAKGVEGERKSLQAAHLISEIRQIAKETFPRNIEIGTDIPKDLWTISGDATQLHQVLMNLCVNARNAMPDGGILHINAENLFIDESYARINTEARIGSCIAITVSDTGTGIPPEIMDRIFEPFFTTREHGKGTGLGLSTSLGIVKSHGGFITVYSEVGKGTVFKVHLPAITTAETIKAQVHQHELPEGNGELILVVDDEDQIREMTKKTLEIRGYKVITASDGKEAIASYSQHRELIKAVLMDMMMPVMDGLASIREMHKINPDIKVIAVSGLTEKDKITKVDDAHVRAFLTKPYTAEKLLNVMNDILRQ